MVSEAQGTANLAFLINGVPTANPLVTSTAQYLATMVYLAMVLAALQETMARIAHSFALTVVVRVQLAGMDNEVMVPASTAFLGSTAPIVLGLVLVATLWLL